eukprot:scaffold100_cov323-Pavlova_lutheri.AAC.31
MATCRGRPLGKHVFTQPCRRRRMHVREVGAGCRGASPRARPPPRPRTAAASGRVSRLVVAVEEASKDTWEPRARGCSFRESTRVQQGHDPTEWTVSPASLSKGTRPGFERKVEPGE